MIESCDSEERRRAVDRAFGLGMLTAIALTASTWVFVSIMGIGLNPGGFSGTFIVGVFYVWKGRKRTLHLVNRGENHG